MSNVIKFANDKGYENVEFLGEYDGAKVYSAIYRNNMETYMVGLPACILDDGDMLEWVQDDRSFEILNSFYLEDDC